MIAIVILPPFSYFRISVYAMNILINAHALTTVYSNYPLLSYEYLPLHTLLNNRGYPLSLRTILRCQTSLGCTFRGSSYCQLIRNVNKDKRLEWAKESIGKDFSDVVWTDECSIQLSTHRRFCCRKKGERLKNKPRYKYIVSICMFSYYTCR